MADGVTVQGPDGKTYQFPAGTDKTAAITYFKKKGIAASPEQEATARHARSTEGKNIVKGSTGGETGITGFATGLGKDAASYVGNKSQTNETKPEGLAENLGAMTGEAIAFTAGGELLKGASVAGKVKSLEAAAKTGATVGKELSRAKKAELLLNAFKAGGIGGVQSFLHGEKHPVAEGAFTGLSGAAGEWGAQKIGEMAPRAASKAYSSINQFIGLNASDMPKWERLKVGASEDIGKTILNEVGLKPSLAEQGMAIEAKRSLLNKQIQSIVENTPSRGIPLHANLDAMEHDIGSELLLYDDGDKLTSKLKDNIKAIKDRTSPNVDVKTALALRQEIGKAVTWNKVPNALDNVRQQVLRRLYGDLNDSIKVALPTDAADKFSQINRTQSRLIIARDAAAEKLENQAKRVTADLLTRGIQAGKGAAKGAATGTAYALATGGDVKRDALIGAAGGVVVGGSGKEEIPEAKVAERSKKIAKIAASPGIREFVRRASPAAGRALESALAAHGGGTGSISGGTGSISAP